MTALHRPVKTIQVANVLSWALSAPCLADDGQGAGSRRCVLPRAFLSDRLSLPLVADLPRHANSLANEGLSLSNHLANACKHSVENGLQVLHGASVASCVVITSHHNGERKCPSSHRKPERVSCLL